MASHQHRDSVETLYFRVAKVPVLKAFSCTMGEVLRCPESSSKQVLLQSASDRLMTKYSFAFKRAADADSGAATLACEGCHDGPKSNLQHATATLRGWLCPARDRERERKWPWQMFMNGRKFRERSEEINYTLGAVNECLPSHCMGR